MRFRSYATYRFSCSRGILPYPVLEERQWQLPTAPTQKPKSNSAFLVSFAYLGLFTACNWGQAGAPPARAATSSASALYASETATEASGATPLGAIPPPGKQWHVVANDRFDQDDSINETLWNGGTGGGMPQGFCGTVATSCGYTGKDCQSYFGTYPDPPYAAIARGLGLAIQATHALPGDNKYFDNQQADIQNYGKLTIHPGSFVEWEARMPTDQHGEGDGWHVDLWCSTLVRHRCDDSSEVDIAEKILSEANNSTANYIVHDQPVGVHTVIEKRYGAPGGGDLSTGFHTYGLLWSNDRLGKEGSLQAYIDGKPIVDHPAPINDPSWESGAYCYAGWMQQELELFGDGAAISANTSSKNPLIIKRFTVWQAY